MANLEHTRKSSALGVRLRDCSKYGTFVNRKMGSKEKVHEFANKEAPVKDGDTVSFGTGNATYRFCFVPLKFLVLGSEPFKENQLQEKISSIGATMTCEWSPDCTHVLVNQSMELTENLVDPFLAKKPFVLAEWVEVVVDKRVCTEIPSWDCYAPTVMLEGVSVKVAGTTYRESCLRQYSFLLEAIDKYQFKDKLLPLLEFVGAQVVLVEDFSSHSQGPEDKEDKMFVLVIPFGMTNNLNSSSKLSSLSRLKEKDVICAAFSGHLDPTLIVSAPVVVSSSCSTDETIVADSDVEEMETVTSLDKSTAVDTTVSYKEEEMYTVTEPAIPKSKMISCSSAKRDQDDIPECGNVDVIYSQNLIVRDASFPASTNLSYDDGVPNFKRFRKLSAPSENSFNSLIPYAKNPYNESGYENEVVESVKEEKKRKHMEAMAEEIFNNEKGRKRGVSGSISALFARS